MLNRVRDFIWTAQQPLRFMGLEVGARMTVIDWTGKGDLLLHSPIQLTVDLKSELSQIGQVRAVVAPNLLHHLYLSEVYKSYPQANYYCVPGLSQKKPELTYCQTVENEAIYPWSEAFDHHLVGGTPQVNEVVLFHRSSRSLIVADLGLHICEDSAPLTRLSFWLMGGYRKYGWAPIEKKLFIRDQLAFQKSMDRINQWDFDNILLCHGRRVQGSGKQAFQAAFLNSFA